MKQNPIIWAGLAAVIFFLFNREEFLPANSAPATTFKTSSALPLTDVSTLPPATAPVLSQALQAELRAIEQQLPLKTDLAAEATEQPHSTPASLVQAAAAMGALIDKANAQAERQKPTLEFLLRCAENNDLANSTRAICWSKLTDKLNEWKVFIPVADAQVPLKVQQLATRLASERRKSL